MTKISPPSVDNKAQILNWLLNISFAAAFMVLGILATTFTDKLEKVEERVVDMPIHFVLKSDYISDQNHLITQLSEIKSAIVYSTEKLQADNDRRMDKLEKLILDELKSRTE